MAQSNKSLVLKNQPGLPDGDAYALPEGYEEWLKYNRPDVHEELQVLKADYESSLKPDKAPAVAEPEAPKAIEQPKQDKPQEEAK